MESKLKYELLNNDTIEYVGFRYWRIRALRDFGKVRKGQLGGYVGSGDHLSHNGDCWIADEARVGNGARVEGNAWVGGKATVASNAKISGNAIVDGEARIDGNSSISGQARVAGNAAVLFATVTGDARVMGHSSIHNVRLKSGTHKNVTVSDWGEFKPKP